MENPYGKISSLKELKKLGLALKPNELDAIYTHYIKEHLIKYDLSVADLAKLTGISRQNLATFISYKSVPNMVMAIKIAKVFGVPVEEMFVLNEVAWYENAKVDVKTNKTLYLDCLTFDLITSNQKNQLLKDEQVDLWIHLTTKERRFRHELSLEELNSGEWYPRFQRLVQRLEPVILKEQEGVET